MKDLFEIITSGVIEEQEPDLERAERAVHTHRLNNTDVNTYSHSWATMVEDKVPDNVIQFVGRKHVSNKRRRHNIAFAKSFAPTVKKVA
jgi:predicted subunit of tRNA(5-methylaminomethyl-2-thiouridylate) methyltransferase